MKNGGKKKATDSKLDCQQESQAGADQRSQLPPARKQFAVKFQARRVRNCRLPASSLLLSFRPGSYIFVDGSLDACNISEAIFL